MPRKEFLLLFYLLLSHLGFNQCLKDPDYAIAEKYLMNEKIDNSLKYFNLVTEKNPDCHYAWYWKGWIKDNYLGKLNEAMDDLNKSIEILPTVDAYLARSVVKIKQNKYGEVEQDFVNALKLDSTHPTIYSYRGNFYEETKRHKEAIDNYNLAIKYLDHIPENYVALNCKGIKNLNKKSFLVDLYYFRAVSEESLENYKAAIADYEAMLKLKIMAYYVRYDIGMSYLALKDTSNGIKNLETYLRMERGNKSQIEKGMIKLAEVYYFKKDYSKSLKYIKKGLKAFPQNEEFKKLENLIEKS